MQGRVISIYSSAEIDLRCSFSFVDTENFGCLLLGRMCPLNTRPPMAPNDTELQDRTDHTTVQKDTVNPDHRYLSTERTCKSFEFFRE